ncbi:MAG: endonuclease/exonuclease/phosphatase family protein [candidate division Zixibacteria bacterium]|nr:endonuclease/exonuclease/phosphatase family protein [Candidatus Tariuqbacter arcticus]
MRIATHNSQPAAIFRTTYKYSWLILIPAVIYLWKFLPPFIPAMEIFAMNQTIRLTAGLFFLLASSITLYASANHRILPGAASLIAVLLMCDALTHSCAQNSENTSSPAEMSFTLYCQNVLYSGPRSDEIVEIVKELSPDIMIFQEMNTPRAEAVSADIEALGYNSILDLEHPTEGAFSLAVFSRLPLRNNRIIISEGPDWKPKWPAQIFEFKFNDRWISVANLHIVPSHHPPSGRLSHIRPSQKKLVKGQMEDIIQALSNGQTPSIICGDFNQTPASKYLRLLDDYWIDSWCETGEGFGFTYPNPNPLFRIDYIYHTEDLRTIVCEKIKNSFSDHQGLFAVMTSLNN